MPGQDEVHVWTVLVPDIMPYLPELEQVLSSGETQRAARFVRPVDRCRYIAAHGILRQLLGGYLGLAPAGLEFVANDFGKPSLAPGAGRTPLSFNLTHSGDVILYVFGDGRHVGVDVEAIRTDLNIMELAQGQFSPQEIATLQATNPSDQTGAFFRCWTRKEAYLKARGEGLGFPLKQFAVSFGNDEPTALLWAADDSSASERWSVFDLVPAPGYAAAVVSEGRPGRVVGQCWP